MRKIYIVLPAYNEEESIGTLLKRIADAMADARIDDYEVIVVNDGSADGTLGIVQEMGRSMPIDILTHQQNQGLGATIRDGLYEAAKKAADKDIVVTMDADDTHSPGLILRMIRMIREGHDVVIASRYRPGARVIGLSMARKLMSYGASWIFRILTPIHGVRDFTCGFRAYHATALKNAIATYGDAFVDQEGFQCMVDILLKMRKMSLIFGEAPIILRYDYKRGASKMNVGKTVKNTLKLVVKRIFE
ncbi:MAG: glycosyltransferase family 2 protein [Saprospiraceae bacterium]|nr:glycosyltransferase family 2 protein [Saprospiraceae bacterium]